MVTLKERIHIGSQCIIRKAMTCHLSWRKRAAYVRVRVCIRSETDLKFRVWKFREECVLKVFY